MEKVGSLEVFPDSNYRIRARVSETSKDGGRGRDPDELS